MCCHNFQRELHYSGSLISRYHKGHNIYATRHQSATSKVELTHRESGASLRFLPLEALRLVNAREDLIRVSYSASWLASRSENPHHNKIAHPYDWTYTTNYKGDIHF